MKILLSGAIITAGVSIKQVHLPEDQKEIHSANKPANGRLLQLFQRFILISLLSFSFNIQAQNHLRIYVGDSLSREPIPGALVLDSATNKGVSTGPDGMCTFILNDGRHHLLVNFIGYSPKNLLVNLPLTDSLQVITALLPEKTTDLEEIIVSTNRTNSRIDDLPEKIEVLGAEDMDEESTIVPGNITGILGDLSIITIQHTSQLNGNDAIRMQGLDSRYTQLMRDGLPLYGGFSGSLGALSIAPLDLKQVEIIKGSASTLYGGGAIGGLINFISKTPVDSAYTILTLNGTSLGEGNLNGFGSTKKGKAALTLFGGVNMKQAADINKDGFAEVPQDYNFSVHPRLFISPNEKTSVVIGFSSNYNERQGGDMHAIKHHADSLHPYLQTETTFRNTLYLSYSARLLKNNTLTFNSATSSFKRDLKRAEFKFNGTQVSTFSELNDLIKIGKHTMVTGINLMSQTFTPEKNNTSSFYNYSFYTTGIFLQDSWQVHKKLSIQPGLRYDHHNTFGDFLLPRIALFYKPVQKLSLRISGGTGYKTPDMFDLTEPVKEMTNISGTVKAEKSHGLNADISFHSLLLGKIIFTVDQAFYYTNIKQPVILTYDSLLQLTALNSDYEINSYGTDTYVRMDYQDVELYLGYNHTECFLQSATDSYNMPFNPKDKFSATLAYEIENNWRMGVEAAYTANQYISGSRKVPDFLFMAAMLERKFKRGSIVLNCENLLDSRQSKYESLISGTVQSPEFKPVWGPLEGRVLNISVKILI